MDKRQIKKLLIFASLNLFLMVRFFVRRLFPPIQSENQIAYNYFLNGA